LTEKDKIKSLQAYKIGVLGGGQLGRMMLQEATTWDLDLHFLDKEFDFPVPSIYRRFHKGDFNNYEDVVAFGKEMDIITIEIENVNTDALKHLESLGKTVYPQASVIELIKDKGLQKAFYQKELIPTSPFTYSDDKAAILNSIDKGDIKLPFIQKSRLAGYDGKGVAAIIDQSDIDKIIDAPSIIEDLVDIDKELAVIVSRNAKGEVASFPVVEMVFNQKGNLLDYLICPSETTKEIAEQCDKLARAVIGKLEMVGILAVEFFLTKSGNILVNEVAPRAHNSGHHTINFNNYSQYNYHLRALLNLPFPYTRPLYSYGLMWNILGEVGHKGEAYYEGLDEVLEIEGVYPHLYGKTITKPLRKMGHLNIVGDSKEEVLAKLDLVKNKLKVKAWNQS